MKRSLLLVCGLWLLALQSLAQAPAEAGDPNELTALPKLLETVEAVYPERAMAERLDAEVMLEIDIGTEGQVEAVNVLTPSAHAGYGFEEAAVLAAQKFRFSPALAGETPVPVRISYRFTFALAPLPPEPVSAPSAEAAPKTPVAVNLQGQLLVRGTREPIAGVAVNVFRGSPGAPEKAFEARTDKDGRFEFYDLEAGTWNVLVEADGFFPVRSAEQVEAGQRTDVRYYVERGSYNPFDVLVEADRPRREVSRTSLRTEEIELIPGTAGDMLQVVQNLPGVARAPAFSGDIIVRGAAPEDTKVVVESLNIPLIYHFGGLRSVIPTPMLKGIDFYPGNFSPEFGRAIGGVIDVRLRDLTPDHLGVKADVSVVDSSLYVEAPLGDKGAIAIAARRSYLDFIIDAAAGSIEDVNIVSAPRYYDAQVLAQYRPAAGHKIRAFGLLSDDELRILFDNPGEASVLITNNEARAETSFYRGILEYEYTPNTRFTNTMRGSVGTDSDYIAFGQFFISTDTFGVQLRDTASYRINDHLRVEGGLDYLFQRYDFRVLTPSLPPREGQVDSEGIEANQSLSTQGNNVPANSLGAFSQLELTFGGLTLLPGVRYDYFSLAEGHRVSPRFTARHKLDERFSLKGAVGLFYQEPPIDETDETYGNPDVGPEGAVHYSLGFEYHPTDWLTLDVTGFYKNMFDLVAPSDRLIERDGELVEERVANRGIGRVVGGEFLVRHEFAHNFSGWATYTIMRSERKDAPDQPWRLFDYDQTHIFTMLGTYRLPRNWEVGFRFRLVSGNPSTPVRGAILNSDMDEYEGVNGKVNSRRVPAFHQLDLRIDKHWIHDTWRFSAYLDVQNVYNRANPDSVEYSFDFSERRYSQGLPILPIFGLRAEY